jgi:uncharacterized protein
VTPLPRHWVGGRVGPTALYNALSVVLPPLERAVIRAARGAEVEDAALVRQIRELCAQEGDHSREHGRLNARIAAHGLPVAAIDRRWERGLRRIEARLSRRSRLAAAAAVEHVTAVMSCGLLRRPARWLGGAPDDVMALWRWHAEEEAEHCAVMFDTYAASGGGWVRRVAVGAAVFVALSVGIAAVIAILLAADGGRGLRASPGLLVFVGAGVAPFLPITAAYVLPGFHPRWIGLPARV